MLRVYKWKRKFRSLLVLQNTKSILKTGSSLSNMLSKSQTQLASIQCKGQLKTSKSSGSFYWHGGQDASSQQSLMNIHKYSSYRKILIKHLSQVALMPTTFFSTKSSNIIILLNRQLLKYFLKILPNFLKLPLTTKSQHIAQ